MSIVVQGAAAIANWRRKNPGVRLDLAAADFPMPPADVLEVLEDEWDLARTALEPGL